MISVDLKIFDEKPRNSFLKVDFSLLKKTDLYSQISGFFSQVFNPLSIKDTHGETTPSKEIQINMKSKITTNFQSFYV